MQPQAVPEPVHRVQPHDHTIPVLPTTQGLRGSWTSLLLHSSRPGWIEILAAHRRSVPDFPSGLRVNLTLLEEKVFHAVAADGSQVNDAGRLHKHRSHMVQWVNKNIIRSIASSVKLTNQQTKL